MSHLRLSCFLHYRPPTKLWEGNVFTGVCLSTSRGKADPHLETDPALEAYLHERTWDQTRSDIIPPPHTPGKNMGPDRQWHHTLPPPTTTKKVGSTHPTGILSCFLLQLRWFCQNAVAVFKLEKCNKLLVACYARILCQQLYNSK